MFQELKPKSLIKGSKIMSNFILTKEQHVAFKAAWKNYLKTEAKAVKKSVKSGNRSRAYAISFHVLRHILISDVEHIEQKIVKAFASQKVGTWDGSAARAGLSDITYYFASTERLLSRYPTFKEFFETLDLVQKQQIVKIATEIHSRYLNGAIK